MKQAVFFSCPKGRTAARGSPYIRALKTRMSEHYVLFRRSRFHYSRWGEGNRVLFAFHGYGESAASFRFLAAALARDFTVIAIDMPFHGETEWNEGHLFAPGDLLGLLSEIAAGLPGGGEEWSLLGYSMGGRVALQLVELAPEKIPGIGWRLKRVPGIVFSNIRCGIPAGSSFCSARPMVCA